jgi:hypothetical protein
MRPGVAGVGDYLEILKTGFQINNPSFSPLMAKSCLNGFPTVFHKDFT